MQKSAGGGQSSGQFSGSLSGQDFSFMNSVPKTGRKWDFLHDKLIELWP